LIEVLRASRLVGIRTLAALLVAVGALVIVSIRFLKKLHHPMAMVDEIKKRTVLWPWLANSYKLILGTLAYNAFVFLVVEPILRRGFPPLKPWEHVTGVFAGSTRTTYEEIAPLIATVLWIAGNALVITLLHGNRRQPVADPAP
jgi:hypothetical protein